MPAVAAVTASPKGKAVVIAFPTSDFPKFPISSGIAANEPAGTIARNSG